jgi:formate dehydrogenase subunit gamma
MLTLILNQPSSIHWGIGQQAMNAPSFSRQVLDDLIDDYSSVAGGLLPLLHALQDAFGYVPPESVPAIAKGLNLSRAEVHGVISYYHHFRTEPVGKNVLQICRAEACQAMGGEALWDAACQHVGGHGTSADGAITLEAAYCLGLCASSPAMVVNDRVHARVTAASLQRVLQSCGSRP